MITFFKIVVKKVENVGFKACLSFKSFKAPELLKINVH